MLPCRASSRVHTTYFLCTGATCGDQTIPNELQGSTALHEADRLTATIMMQLSRNPNPTKGSALCSRTAKSQTQTIRHQQIKTHTQVYRSIQIAFESALKNNNPLDVTEPHRAEL